MMYFPDIQEALDSRNGETIMKAIAHHRDSTIMSDYHCKIPVYRKYASGEQCVTLTADQRKVLEGLLGNEYCDNFCGQVVSEAASRIQLLKWSSEDEATQQYLNDTYAKAHVKKNASNLHYDTIRDGNCALAINWKPDAKYASISREPWWDGTQGIFCINDPYDPNVVLAAMKEWQVYNADGTNGYRRLVWVGGALYRWYSTGRADWQPYMLAQDNGQWPVKWVDKDNNVLPVPVVHFANNGLITDHYGNSDIAGGLTGAQDQLNDSQMMISAASRFTAFQIITMTGIAPDPDEDGNEKPMVISPGAVLKTKGQGNFGHIPAGSLDSLIAGYQHKLASAARNARVPVHRLGQGNPPSGEALVRAEGPAIAKAERQIESLRPNWSQTGYLVVRLSNAFAGTNYDVESTIDAVMEEPDKRDKTTKSTFVMNMKDFLSRKEALRIVEYSDAQAEQIVSELQEEAQEAANMAFENAKKMQALNPDPAIPAKTGNDPKAKVK